MNGLGLAASKNCLECHDLEKYVVGPSFKAIATKYAGVGGVRNRLSAKIRAGGVGVWGPVPMPVNNLVTDAEATALAEWVLTVR